MELVLVHLNFGNGITNFDFQVVLLFAFLQNLRLHGKMSG